VATAALFRDVFVTIRIPDEIDNPQDAIRCIVGELEQGRE
jgi:hypothetical protein